jgi:phenylalanyl-tRNA synthetase beta chain
VAEASDVRGARVIVAELEVAGLASGHLGDVRAVAPSRHQASERDLAIVVPERVPAAAIADAIRSAGGGDLRSVSLYDLYRGTPLAPDEKSLAWRLVFQADDRTLTEAELDAAVEAIQRAVAAAGGRIRT